MTSGEFACLMGPSGSGKSTLLNLVGGLDRPTKGQILIEGKDTGALTESQFAALRHDTIGFIFQSYNLIPFLSAVENVELPLIFEPYDRAVAAPPRDRPARPGRARPSAAPTRRAGCPAASSSARRSPAPWSPTPG